jgi:hypothetical protein
VSLILQGAGGGIAATGISDQHQLNLGTNIMIAGLSFQVFSLLLFMALCADFALRVRKLPRSEKNERYESMRRTRLFRGFLLGMLPTVGSNHSCNATSNSSTRTALGVSTLFVFIRCCYRVAELQAGFGGALANNEAVFEVLEGPMIMVAVIALSVFHPGFCFGGMWTKIGVSTVDRDRAAAVHSLSRFARMRTILSRSAGRPDTTSDMSGFAKATTDTSVLKSKEDVSSE